MVEAWTGETLMGNEGVWRLWIGEAWMGEAWTEEEWTGETLMG